MYMFSLARLNYYTYAPAAAEVNAPQGHEGKNRKNIVKIHESQRSVEINIPLYLK